MPPNGDAWALFLDLDGTLAEITETPEHARLGGDQVHRLERLHGLLGGALALVSGRPLVDLDKIAAPARLPAAGVHGAEWRVAADVMHRSHVDPRTLDPVRRAFAEFTARHPGTVVEDKGAAVALHYRRNPAARDAAVRLAEVLAREVGPAFHALHGKMVVELRPRAVTKGTAVAEFLRVPPFAGRQPVYVGDDRTDEDAFATVNARGGIAIVVGAPGPTHARHRLASVPDVHRWLDRVARRLDAGMTDE